jgi:hypothetical protein
LRTSGLLRLVPSYDLGTLGPREGEATFYSCHWYYGAPRLALWAVLGLVMVVPRANRHWQVLLILVPVLLVNLVWSALVLISKPATSDQELLGAMALSLAVGSAVLWLLGHRLANCTRGKAMLVALGATVGVAVAGIVPVLDSAAAIVTHTSLLGILMWAMVLGYALAGRMSRHTYHATRFILLLAAGTVVFSMLGILLWCLLGFVVTGDWPTNVFSALAEICLVSWIPGTCVFAVSLSFVVVGLCSPLFRPRLFACLGLPPKPMGPKEP